MQKRILFIDHHSELSGGEIAMLEIVKTLDRKRFHPLVLLGKGGLLADNFRACGVEVFIEKLPEYFIGLRRASSGSNRMINLVKSMVAFMPIVNRTRRIITAHNIDIVYINSPKSLLYAALAARITRKVSIWHLHDCLSRDFYSKPTIKIIILAAALITKVICVSDIVRNKFISAGGDPGKAVVIYNGVDTDRFHPSIFCENIKTSLRLENKTVISIVGRLEHWKGQRVFINAAKKVSDKFHNVVFLIVGEAFFGFEEYEKDLRILVQSTGMQDKVLFMGFQENPEQFYALSDLVVHCSIKPEPFGRDIIEAFACAKPVIASNIGAASEIIDNNNGVLIEAGDSDVLADSIIALLQNPDYKASLAVNARQTALKRFDIKKITKQIEDIIIQL